MVHLNMLESCFGLQVCELLCDASTKLKSRWSDDKIMNPVLAGCCGVIPAPRYYVISITSSPGYSHQSQLLWEDRAQAASQADDRKFWRKQLDAAEAVIRSSYLSQIFHNRVFSIPVLQWSVDSLDLDRLVDEGCVREARIRFKTMQLHRLDPIHWGSQFFCYYTIFL